MIFTVCIQIFVVSSMFLQKLINESLFKKQWHMTDSEFTQQKQQRSKKFPSKLSMFQICLFNESSTNNRRSSKETSMFWRLTQNKFLSLMFASKSSKSYQRFCIGSSTTNQSSSRGISTFWWISHYKLQWSLPFASKSS